MPLRDALTVTAAQLCRRAGKRAQSVVHSGFSVCDGVVAGVIKRLPGRVIHGPAECRLHG